MIALALIAAAALSAEPCAVVRREQGEFTAKIHSRIQQMERASKRPDGSLRPLTAAERKEFAAIEADVEAFITRFNARLSNCTGN